MNEPAEGRILRRGGAAIGIGKVDDTFTVMLSAPGVASRLRATEGVSAVEPVVPEVPVPAVARVEVTSPDLRDAVMKQIREKGDIVVHHEYVSDDNPSTTYQLTDKIILEFHPGVPLDVQRDVLDAEGVVIKKQYEEPTVAYLVVVTERAQGNPVKVANRLERHDEVEYAEPVLVNRPVLSQWPNDSQLREQWHLDSSAHAAPDVAQDADISAAAAWRVTQGSRDVVVAVIDDGFDLRHPDFAVAGKIVDPVDFRGGDDLPLPEAGDFHGTSCAGLAVAEANGAVCVGVAPGCSLMPVRFSIEAHDDRLIEYFTYVSSRAHIVSCSWSEDPVYKPLSTRVSRTLSHLARNGGKDGRGLVIVFASGNADAPLDATVVQPIRWSRATSSGLQTFESKGRIVNGWPAHPDVIAVSACTSLNRKALYSNWGAEISVAAPSSNRDPITGQPLPGRGITTDINEYRGTSLQPGRRYTNSFGGTSAACPIVAGVAALVKSVDRSLGALEIRDILCSTADKVVDRSVDPLRQHNKGTYDARGHSEWFGYGKVNAGRAVAEAVRRHTQPDVPAEGDRVQVSALERLLIPDADALGVTSQVNVDADGELRDVVVLAVVSHPHFGDLRIALRAPGGETALLYDGEGGGGVDLRLRWNTATTPALAALVRRGVRKPRGAWRLIVADVALDDVGSLAGWTLVLTLG